MLLVPPPPMVLDYTLTRSYPPCKNATHFLRLIPFIVSKNVPPVTHVPSQEHILAYNYLRGAVFIGFLVIYIQVWYFVSLNQVDFIVTRVSFMFI
jgi:hypothetical protein